MPNTKEPVVPVGYTRQGYGIYRIQNGVGGHQYLSDECGAVLWDTSFSCIDTQKQLINIEIEFQKRKNNG